MQKKVLVLGFYNKKNYGDELYKQAFPKIFPEYQFTFTDQISEGMLDKYDAIFIGGGSLLDGQPEINYQVMLRLRLHQKKLCYISVGSETNIHPIHLSLMKEADLIAFRGPANLDNAKFYKDVIIIPDLVYSLSFESVVPKVANSVLILSNANVVPKWNEPYWKQAAWHSFKVEFAQFLDYLVEEKYWVDFFPMCLNKETNDEWTAHEIINHMQNKNDVASYFQDEIDMSQYEIIISQRYHGCILSELSRIPYLSIHHHDKLKHTYLDEGKFIPYYGITKGSLKNAFEEAQKLKLNQDAPIKLNIYDELKEKVQKIIG